MRKDEWIQSAMTDDTMVADLLMRISSDSYASSLPPIPDNTINTSDLDLIKWGLRKPRSRLLTMRYNQRQISIKKENDLTRASPTTPFSWSPGSSISGGSGNSGVGSVVDCYEESSRPSIWSSNHNSRSKVKVTTTVTTGPNVSRSRKKQKVADLKEEENFLLKERINLKEELVTLTNSFEGRKAVNDSLKRIKLDLKTWSARETSGSCDASTRSNYSDQFRNTREIVDETPIFRTKGKFNGLEFCEVETKLSSAVRGSFFVLPDLNMPLEEDSCADVLYGLS